MAISYVFIDVPYLNLTPLDSLHSCGFNGTNFMPQLIYLLPQPIFIHFMTKFWSLYIFKFDHIFPKNVQKIHQKTQDIGQIHKIMQKRPLKRAPIKPASKNTPIREIPASNGNFLTKIGPFLAKK